MLETQEIDFSKLESKIEKQKTNKEKLDNLKVNLKTRTEENELVKNNLGLDLEKINFLSRIDEVSKMCNNNSEKFLNICKQDLGYLD